MQVRHRWPGQPGGVLLGLVVVALLGVTTPAVSPPAWTPASISPSALPATSDLRGAIAPTLALRTATNTSYRLDPAGGSVHVTVRITLTNQEPDVVDGDYLKRSFLDRFGLPVLAEAEGFVASRGGNPLSVERVPRRGAPIATASIDLVPNLFSGDTQTIDLTYRLPALPPRGSGFSRVNAAFVTFPVFAVGDPRAADIEVIVPKGFNVDFVGSPMVKSGEEEVVTYRAVDIADPDSFLTSVVARDDDALVAVPVTFGEHTLTVLAWPGDDEWARFVAGKVDVGVPELERLIGLPWPGLDDLKVIETASPYLYGYAGWYSPSESLVEIGDELDPDVILHELSHLWFNQNLFAERWINEGLAEVYAALALGRLGDVVTPPSPVDSADPGRLPLLEWSDPDLKEPISSAQESYGYNASQVVLHDISQEIGTKALSRVLVAADKRLVAYEGDGKVLRYPSALGWRELLDLLDEVGGSTKASAAFAQLVLTDDLQASLEERATARARYRLLVGAGGGWTAPRGVRFAMARWRFDAAGRLMATADEVMKVRRDLSGVLAPVDVPVPAALEDDYETAADAADLEAATSGVLDAGRRMAEAVAAQRGASGPLVAIGSLGGKADGDLADAREAFDLGHYENAAAEAAAAARAYDGAAAAGALRLAVALLAVVAVTLVIRRRTGSGEGGVDVDVGVPVNGDPEHVAASDVEVERPK